MTKLTRNTVLPLIEQGLSQKQIAERLGVWSSNLSAFIKAEGLRKMFWKRRNISLAHPPNERAFAMKARYETGETLQQIGDSYSITRERVRQILTKHFGFNWQSGGRCKTANEKRVARRAALDAKCVARFGHDLKAHRALQKIGREMMGRGAGRERTPIGAFVNQRNNARQRGIAWEFTLAQWWKMWLDSGKWEERGRGRGYCMCRFGDEGPYSADNCYIATGVENIHDYYDLRDVVGPVRSAA